MAFKVPTFPLVANIWQAAAAHAGSDPPAGIPAQTPCALRMIFTAFMIGTSNVANATMLLLLPPLTDIRGPHFSNVAGDEVEVPAGSGRFYNVSLVDDAHKGFPNEYRVASLSLRTNKQGGWPYPTP